MLFKCGKNSQERHALEQKLVKEVMQLKSWHPYFAWRPMKINEKEGTCVWLQWIERTYLDAWVSYRFLQIFKDQPMYRLKPTV